MEKGGLAHEKIPLRVDFQFPVPLKGGEQPSPPLDPDNSLSRLFDAGDLFDETAIAAPGGEKEPINPIERIESVPILDLDDSGRRGRPLDSPALQN
jgi:hypothetical protein